ncbi:MAG: CBS domain-containing protein [Deltaproteobacteria bacterium]|nr:CBS domain-containing protein [Deltaproteobacteria bacterium]
MPVVKNRSILTGIQVKEAMRRNVHRLSLDDSIAVCIRHMIKFKNNAVLVNDVEGAPCGVVSKTDILGVYYAGLPVDTTLQDVMAGPPQFCYPDDKLEDAIDMMQNHGIHRLYVLGADSDKVTGTLAYTDIVGLLYRFCRTCSKSLRKTKKADNELPQLKVKDVMTAEIVLCKRNDSIKQVVEVISTQRLGAILIVDGQIYPVGVISKTDIVIAYVHGVSIDEPAENIMNTPVTSCSWEELLSQAIKQMLLNNIQRIFVYMDDKRHIKGVLSLSDAARFRSGTCKACVASRIIEGI